MAQGGGAREDLERPPSSHDVSSENKSPRFSSTARKPGEAGACTPICAGACFGVTQGGRFLPERQSKCLHGAPCQYLVPSTQGLFHKPPAMEIGGRCLGRTSGGLSSRLGTKGEACLELDQTSSPFSGRTCPLLKLRRAPSTDPTVQARFETGQDGDAENLLSYCVLIMKQITEQSCDEAPHWCKATNIFGAITQPAERASLQDVEVGCGCPRLCQSTHTEARRAARGRLRSKLEPVLSAKGLKEVPRNSVPLAPPRSRPLDLARVLSSPRALGRSQPPSTWHPLKLARTSTDTRTSTSTPAPGAGTSTRTSRPPPSHQPLPPPNLEKPQTSPTLLPRR